jgi:methionyl-tRNA formyltransferase
MPCRVVFIGATPSGEKVLRYFLERSDVDVVLVNSYPIDSKISRNINIAHSVDTFVYRCTDVNSLATKIASQNPDFIFVSSWSFLLNPTILQIPKKGVIGFHPSKLPLDRGRSVLAWQIAEGYVETALTMFYLDDSPDCGDIIGQKIIPILPNDYIEDVLKKTDDVMVGMVETYFPLLKNNCAPRIPQDSSDSTYRRLRTNKDSQIDWHRPAQNIYNHIRAISHPYPGAQSSYQGHTVKIWRAEVLQYDNSPKGRPSYSVGQVIKNLPDNWYVVRCGKGLIKIKVAQNLNLNDVFSSDMPNIIHRQR